MEFNNEKKAGTIEFDGIRDGYEKRATFKLKLVRPFEAEDTFDAGDLYWDRESKQIIGIKFSEYSSIAKGYHHNGDVCLAMPDEIITYIQGKDAEIQEELRQEKINQDFQYNLNDTTAYGIYNGISEFDIESLVNELKTQYDKAPFLFSDDIAKLLNDDKELKKIALDTYQAYPVDPNWRDDIKKGHLEAAKQKKASGFGTIPNSIIREKINKLLADEYEKEMKKEQAYDEKVNALLEKAKETGERQLISKWTEPCNDPKEECSTDICYYWAMPDGTTEETRHHTW